MSLEAAITENTKAITALTAILTANAAAAPAGEAPDATTPDTAPAPKIRKPKDTPAAPAAATPPVASGVSVDEIRTEAQKFLDNAGDVARIKEINGKYGLKKVSDAAGTEHAPAVLAALKKLNEDAAV